MLTTGIKLDLRQADAPDAEAEARVHTPAPHGMGEAPAAPPTPPAAMPAASASPRQIDDTHDVRQQLAEIEQVYQYSPVGLVLMDREYRFVRINDRLAEINGLPAEAHIGRTLLEVLPDMADRLIELYRPVYERGEPVLNVELARPIPGQPDMQRQWLANFFPFRSKAGEVIGLIGAVVDITERRQQEDRLRESEERFRTIFETVGDAIFVQDIDAASFVDVNQRAVDMFGYPRDVLLAKSIARHLGEPAAVYRSRCAGADCAGVGGTDANVRMALQEVRRNAVLGRDRLPDRRVRRPQLCAGDAARHRLAQIRGGYADGDGAVRPADWPGKSRRVRRQPGA